MNTILLFGAGKSSGVLIYYLEKLAISGFCKVIVADANEETIKQKLSGSSPVEVYEIDIIEENSRRLMIGRASVVISLMPPNLHYLIALDCILQKKHLLTASYIDEIIKAHTTEISEAGVLFLYEMGLDPGIDHMSAMKLIDTIKEGNGIINSFTSHCGGLVSLESDDNPWHYKISWNPRNVVLAGKSGASYLKNGVIIKKKYDSLFNNCATVNIKRLGNLAYYPNRESLSYKTLYKVPDADTFLRTTLRHPNFCEGWNVIVNLKLTDEEFYYQTDSLSIADFFEQHLKRFGLQEIYEKATNEILIRQQFDFLFKDNATINKGLCSAADVLQFIIERKLALGATDNDMIVMQHEIEYKQAGTNKKVVSTLVVKGEDKIHTAMAKTVGLPLGITAKLILEEKMNISGLHIPVNKEIYQPVLKELEQWGIVFEEEEVVL